MRIGFGEDIHRLAAGRDLILGGIRIPSPRGEVAHSDGDVLTHAIIDAILGAVANGDIGSHYPDTDPAFKDISSIKLLEDTLKSLNGRKIVNLDCTITLDTPKLRPHIDSIRENLAGALGCEISRISVKAKTSEQFFPDMIRAQAAVLID